jgi:hypothetical protein
MVNTARLEKLLHEYLTNEDAAGFKLEQLPSFADSNQHHRHVRTFVTLDQLKMAVRFLAEVRSGSFASV